VFIVVIGSVVILGRGNYGNTETTGIGGVEEWAQGTKNTVGLIRIESRESNSKRMEYGVRWWSERVAKCKAECPKQEVATATGCALVVLACLLAVQMPEAAMRSATAQCQQKGKSGKGKATL
jgi:hypothetical protein